ncbi:unnamed protein product [Paramecium sonneborni]|uniref:Uncharacterized protein n=1 Tax=Paramecium sonneborni TaxID=65129 RepID=A0A8S1RD65_9CILI|nr:unnamed protein product [Paramecium sonneborni]
MKKKLLVLKTKLFLTEIKCKIFNVGSNRSNLFQCE